MRQNKKTIFTGILLFFTFFGIAQLSIDTTQVHADLVQKILIGNDEVKIGNVKYWGSDKSIGSFEVEGDNFSIPKGLILSTGKATAAIGPNKKSNTSNIMNSNGDGDLNELSKSVTYDAAVLEFDFIPLNNRVSFNYIFASEEYIEFTGSVFNDVFAFYISGPEIDGKQNLAKIPGTKKIVAINSVNQYKNSEFFINNNVWGLNGWALPKSKTKNLDKELLSTLEFDGMTTVFTATTNVVPYKRYHLKIAIADVNDKEYNSAVFLEGGSFTSVMDSTADERFLVDADIDVESIDFETLFEIEETELAVAQNTEKKPTSKPKKIRLIEANPEVEDKIEATGPEDEEVVKVIEKAEVPPAKPEEVTNIPAEKTETILTESSKVSSSVVSVFDNIYFETNSYQITEEDIISLNTLLRDLENNENLKVYLYGHTDNVGNAVSNDKLSVNRANAVKKYLTNKGIVTNRIICEAYGAKLPIADNTTEEGRAKNRRVDVFVR